MYKFMGFVFSLVLFSTAGAFAAQKIGFVDYQKAIQMTKEGKKARKALDKEFKKRKSVIKEKEAALEKKNKEFQSKSDAWSQKHRAQKEKELQEEFALYRDLLSRSRSEIEKREKDLTQPILEKMQKSLVSLAKKGKYSVIFDKKSALWILDADDLTDELLKVYSSSK